MGFQVLGIVLQVSGQVHGFGFRVSGFIFWGFGTSVPGAGIRVSGLGGTGTRERRLPPARFRISGFGFGFRFSVFGFRFSVFEFRVSCFLFRVSVVGFRVYDSRFRVSGTGLRFPVFGFRESPRSKCPPPLNQVSVSGFWVSGVTVRRAPPPPPSSSRGRRLHPGVPLRVLPREPRCGTSLPCAVPRLVAWFIQLAKKSSNQLSIQLANSLSFQLPIQLASSLSFQLLIHPGVPLRVPREPRCGTSLPFWWVGKVLRWLVDR